MLFNVLTDVMIKIIPVLSPLKLLCAALLLFAAASNQAAVVIQYHHVDTTTPATTSVTPEQFAAHLEYLASNQFIVWPLPELIDQLKKGNSLPDKVIAITFDDGYKSVYTKAFPLLQQHGYAFTVFINPKLIGGHQYMRLDQLRELTGHGGVIANHTENHAHLVRQLPGETETQWSERVRREMSEAEQFIEKQFAATPALIAYPYGEYNNNVKQIALSLGLTGFTQHSGAFDQNVDRQEIPRYAFGGEYVELGAFADKVNSLPMPLTSVVVKDEHGMELFDPVLPVTTTRPVVTLNLQTEKIASRVQCYVTGQGRVPVKLNVKQVTVQPDEDLPVGRSRINCTAGSETVGRYYWYSQFFMRKQADGSWYPEQ